MKKFSTITALISALVLCFALVGCGDDTKDVDYDEYFEGWWNLDTLETDDEFLTAEDFALIEDFGLNGIMFYADNYADIYMFGELIEGTYIALDEETVEIEVDGETVLLDLIDGDLVWDVEGDILTYVPGPTPDFDAANEEATRPADEVILIDDSLVTISTTGFSKDSLDDIVMTFKVTNNSDKPIIVTNQSGTFAVNDEMCDPLYYAEVLPGKTSTDDMTLFAQNISEVNDIVSMEGVLEVTDKDYNTLASYDIWYQ